MNITFRPLLILAAACTIATACSEEDDSPADNIALEDKTGGEGDDAAGGDDENGAGNEEDRDSEEDGGKKEESDTTALANPCLTDERVYAKYPLLRNLNFVYPSHDPLGRPVMLSGTITMSRDLSPQTRAQGFILYNHYTVFRADECPSKGKLDMQNIIYLTAPHRNFITVSADYYGFGQTEDQMQAYCIATANARASIDALMAARALLADEGYTWDDDLLNVGYSQGAQTAIGVLKVAAEEYPGLSFTRTLAGGGPYDLEETYRQYLAEGSARLPAAVVSILLAYDEYFQLHIPYGSMFQGPTLDHIDDWWLSKQMSSTQIDRMMPSNVIADFIAPPLRDTSSAVARRMMEAMARESLSKGWKPRREENIFLLHHNADDIAPAANTQLLYDFLKEQGVENVEMQKADFITLGISEHISGAAAFLTLVAKWIRDNYTVK